MAIGKRARRGRGGARPRRHGGDGVVLVEDLVVQTAQLGARLGPDGVDDAPSGRPVGVERLRLAAGPVQREQMLGLDALVQRVRGGEGGHFSQHRGVVSAREIGVDGDLLRAEAELLAAADRGRGERLVGEIGERWTAPEGERRTRLTVGSGSAVAAATSRSARCRSTSCSPQTSS